jgi:hypothetical protein
VAFRDRLKQLVSAIRGVSTYSPNTAPGPQLGSEAVDAAREALGGNLEAIPIVRTRFYQKDIERALLAASNGDLTRIGQLHEFMKLDSTYKGMFAARTACVEFPKRFFGNPEIISVLQSKNWSDRDVYSEMIPAKEARLMCEDGEDCGVAIGEMCPVEGRDFPVLVRRFPQNLFYLQTQNTWFYRGVAGNIPIHPGEINKDGGWFVLHTPGGRLSPWNNGLWFTLARNIIGKTEVLYARQSYINKHSHPLRVGRFAQGASEAEQRTLVQSLVAWALNGAVALPDGWDVGLVESNGQGIKIYNDALKYFDEQIATAICGSAVMLQGTVGFSNMDAFQAVAGDLINTTAHGWDHTVSTQILPPFIASKWGVEDVRNATTVLTDTTPPKDQKAQAETFGVLGTAIQNLTGALAPYGLQPNVRELMASYGVPVIAVTPQLATPSAPEKAPEEPVSSPKDTTTSEDTAEGDASDAA